MSTASDPVGDVVRTVLADAWERGDTPEQQAATVRRARELGWHLLGVDEASGGVGGDLADRLRLAELLGAHGCDGPYLEANTALARLTGLDALDRDALQAGEVAVVCAEDFAAPTARAYLDAVGRRPAGGGGHRRGLHRATPDPAAVPGPAGIPLVGLTLDPEPLAADPGLAAAVRADLDLLRCARLAGAIAAVARSSARHAVEREQFGRPLIRFQAVAAMVAEQRAAAELAAAAVEAAAGAVGAARDTAGRQRRAGVHGAGGRGRPARPPGARRDGHHARAPPAPADPAAVELAGPARSGPGARETSGDLGGRRGGSRCVGRADARAGR
jgi:hypothetical protein